MATRGVALSAHTRRVLLADVRPWQVLTALVLVQWATVAGLALDVRHNGWVWYQGGDQIWHYVSAWLLTHGHLPPTIVGYLWAVLLAPIAFVAGPDLAQALPAIVILDVLVLLPVALVAMYGIGERIAGRYFGYLVAALWIALPYFGIRYTLTGYHEKYTQLTLPQSLGLTGLSDFPSMVAVIVAAYLCLRALDSSTWIDAALAGLAAGAAIGMKPSNAIFALAPALVLVIFRIRALAVFALALLPAIVTLAVWKERGLGQIPAFSTPVRHVAMDATANVFTPIHKYLHLDWSHLNRNRLGIREHFWSERLVDFSILGGLLGLVRKSVRAALLVGVWFAAYVILKGTYGGATVDSGSFFRLLMPAFPPFVVLVASLVFLVPGVRAARARPLPRPRGRRMLWVVGAAFALLAVAPFGLVAAARPLRATNPKALVFEGVLRPVDAGLRPSASVHGPDVRLRWPAVTPFGGSRVFYQVLVTPGENGGVSCVQPAGGAAECSLTADTVAATHRTAVHDVRRAGHWTYRVAVSANWLGDTRHGDVYTIGAPLTVTVR